MENQHRSFLWEQIGQCLTWGRGGSLLFRRMLTFWFLSTKQTKQVSARSAPGVQGAEEKSQYYLSFNLKRKCSLQVVFLSSFILFKGERRLFGGSVSTAWIH